MPYPIGKAGSIGGRHAPMFARPKTLNRAPRLPRTSRAPSATSIEQFFKKRFFAFALGVA